MSSLQLTRLGAIALAVTLLLIPAVSPRRADAASFVVNSTLDGPDLLLADGVCDAGGGVCTLRAAIQQANFNPGADTINFSIGGGGVQTIAPATALPDITGAVTIDGTTQPGFGGTPIVVVDGVVAGSGVDGLRVTAGSSTVRGLVIERFSGNGIQLMTNGGNTVAGNYIGVDPDGSTAGGNGVAGLFINNVGNNLVGGTNAAARNVIAGNGATITTPGIEIDGPGASGNVVSANYIGTDASGAAAVPNGRGIMISGAPNSIVGGTTTGERNIISGNDTGVEFDGDTTVVEGNYIGTDVTGTGAIANRYGVFVFGGSTPRIGGVTAPERNVVSGNVTGVFIDAANGAVVEGNYIGTNAMGTSAVPNAVGVWLHSTSGTQVIGGSAAGAGNVISGNTERGVRLLFEFNAGDVVEGNYIGTDAGGTAAVPNGIGIQEASAGATLRDNLVSGNSTTGLDVVGSDVVSNMIGTQRDGVSPLGNGGDGIYRRTGAFPKSVGGFAPGNPNIIAFNGGAGVEVADDGMNPAKQFSLRGNAIYSNGGLGIDLDPAGVTPNDPGDVDSGANDLQNYPVLTATTAGGSTTVQGTLNSTPNAMFAIDIYSNPSCDGSGFGEGKTYVSSISVTTDGAGNAGFSSIIAGVTDVTATATDPAGNTSEFSNCVVPVVLSDTDGDGCPDVRELGASHTTGGQRNPNNFWDFFDVPTPPLLPSNPNGVRNHAISIGDAIAVLAFIGTNSGAPNTPNSQGATYGSDLNGNGRQDGQEYDRTAGAQAWAPGPPNGAVSIADALLAVNSIGDNCN